LLQSDGYEVDFVGSNNSGTSYGTSGFDTDHEGHGGQTSEFIKNNIGTWLTLHPADIILLHIGTNDGGISTPIGTSVENVNAILNTIFSKNPNAKVFVARIIESRRSHQHGGGIVSPENPLGLWRTKDFNDAIENMINNHPQSSNIRVVDMENGAGLEYDVVGFPHDMQPYHSKGNRYDFHPNTNGFEKIAQKWFDDMVYSGWIGTEVAGSSDIPEWYIYEKSVHKATITPLNGTDQSILQSEDIDVQFIKPQNPEVPTVSLHCKCDGGDLAYITSNKQAKISTGFMISGLKKSTLLQNSTFKAGTRSVIKKDRQGHIMIENSVKMQKDDTLIMD